MWFFIRYCADAGLDGGVKRHRTACAGVGHFRWWSCISSAHLNIDVFQQSRPKAAIPNWGRELGGGIFHNAASRRHTYLRACPERTAASVPSEKVPQQGHLVLLGYRPLQQQRICSRQDACLQMLWSELWMKLRRDSISPVTDDLVRIM